MNQIWTNPSLQRSFIQANPSKIEKIDHVVLTVGDTTIHIIPGFEYALEYYDTDDGKYKSVIGMILDVWQDYIKIRIDPTAVQVDCSKCKCDCSKRQNADKKVVGPMPICNCILNPPDMSKYKVPEEVFVPFTNIARIAYIKTNQNQDDESRKGARVMLLGISATTLKAIIIHLEFFDDNFEKAVKFADLEVGGIYDIAYADRDEDNTVYEFTGMLHSIEEITDEVCTGKKDFVRENVGGCNSVYVNSCCTSKSDFMQSPPVKRVKLTFDTSETFTGRYESIWLDCLRDCTLIQAADGNKPTKPDEPSDNDNNVCACCKHKTEGCSPDTCGHVVPKFAHEYKFDDVTSATVDEDGTITMTYITHEGTTSEEKMSMESMIKFYLGLE